MIWKNGDANAVTVAAQPLRWSRYGAGIAS